VSRLVIAMLRYGVLQFMMASRAFSNIKIRNSKSLKARLKSFKAILSRSTKSEA